MALRKLHHSLMMWSIIGLAGTASAGERLTPELLVKRSDAVVEVSTVVPIKEKGNSKFSVHVQGILWASPPAKEIMAKPSWSTDIKWAGRCLPDSHLLKRWMKQFSHFPPESQKSWKRALASGTYESVVFLKLDKATGHLKPTCEAESALAESWKSHSTSEAYRKRIGEILKKRPLKDAKRQTIPATLQRPIHQKPSTSAVPKNQ